MNTVEKGDIFEEKSYDLIVNAIDGGLLAIPKEFAKVYKKKKYFSQKRGKDIIFDLSIEVWPRDANNYSIVYLIECKDYSTKKVPIGDIELFATRVEAVAELNGKAVFITSSSYPQPAIDFARNTGMMLIEANEYEEPSIILYKKENNAELKQLDSVLHDFLKSALTPNKIEGLSKLSKYDISEITEKIYNSINVSDSRRYRGLLQSEMLDYFTSEYGLQFEFGYDLYEIYGVKILGCFDSSKNCILIDQSIIDSSRFSFVLAHEIGHFVLHRNLKMNQEVYNNFKDSQYDIFEDKHTLLNEKNWIEWQANCFAANLLMPAKAFELQLQAYRHQLGISKYQHIYLDNQPQNISDYDKTLKYLSSIFNTSLLSVEYRIEELGLITREISENTYRDSIRNIFQ